MYYIYHIPGVKVGVTTNLKERVERQQGYESGEYKVLTQTEDMIYICGQRHDEYFQIVVEQLIQVYNVFLKQLHKEWY